MDPIEAHIVVGHDRDRRNARDHARAIDGSPAPDSAPVARPVKRATGNRRAVSAGSGRHRRVRVPWHGRYRCRDGAHLGVPPTVRSVEARERNERPTRSRERYH